MRTRMAAYGHSVMAPARRCGGGLIQRRSAKGRADRRMDSRRHVGPVAPGGADSGRPADARAPSAGRRVLHIPAASLPVPRLVPNHTAGATAVQAEML